MKDGCRRLNHLYLNQMHKIKLFEEFHSDKKLKIGIYHDKGVKKSTIQVWNDFLYKFFNVEPFKLNSDNFKLESFKDLDLLIIPGGKAYQESLGISEEGKQDLKNWVSNGGKLLAVCAGFHLVAGGHKWSLDMIPVKRLEFQEEYLTPNVVYLNFEITAFGKQVFEASDPIVNLYYHGGPIVKYEEDGEFKVLLRFAEEVPHIKQHPDFVKGAIAGIWAPYGTGEIIAISPHIEKTPSQQKLLASAARYLIDRNCQLR